MMHHPIPPARPRRGWIGRSQASDRGRRLNYKAGADKSNVEYR
jgi:hypothetical protein